MRSQLVKHLIAFVALVLGLTCLPAMPTRAADQAGPASQAWRVGTMGRQRMLSQRFVKSVCLAHVAKSDETQGHLQQVQDVMTSYVSGLALLRDGDPGKGRAQETNTRILNNISAVSAEWNLLKRIAADFVNTHRMSPQDMADLDAQSLVVLKKANFATQEMSQLYGASTLQVRMAETVNIAGRQRMLTQKMTKELCLAAKRQQMAINLHRFEGSVSLFDATLATLLDGNFDQRLPKAPTPEIRDRLLALDAHWASNRALAADIIAQGDVTNAQLTQFAVRADEILVLAHAIVQLYEAL